MRRSIFLLPVIVAATACAACGEQTPPGGGTTQGPSGKGTNGASSASGAGGSSPFAGASAVASAGVASGIADAGATAYDGPYAGATVFQAPIFSEMEWPPAEGRKNHNPDNTSVRIGYLRHGSKVPIVPTPHKKSNCAEGWYELVAGGFVCGKYITLDLNHPRFKNAHPPDLEAMLPYTYGVNGQHGTPLYRHVPSREERLANEPWLNKPKKPKVTASSGDVTIGTDNPYGDDAGAGSAASAGGSGDLDAGASASHDDPSKPWYLREYDGGTVNITLDELRGEGIVARRMVKGFYLSLDRKFSATGSPGYWWKTTDGLVAPADSVYVAKSRSEFRAPWWTEVAGNAPAPPSPSAAPSPAPSAALASADVDGGVVAPAPEAPRAWKLPVGFITVQSAHKYNMATSRKSASRGGPLHRQTMVQLTGEVATVSGIEYWETDEGWWMKATDGTKTEPGPPPEKLGATEKWIDVNLKRQTLVAFEGDKPVFATIVSSGRAGHETPPGSFRIREKHIASTMDGDADTVSDGPYSIQDVPYIEYFNAGYALHGAFWHDSFGNVKSHGCVNLAPWDAKALFGWTEPQLPEGWHGVMATKDKPGTRVVLHY